MSDKIKIVVICGPTACGKSRLAVDVAIKFGGEVINADSMQVYRGMDIANAMPSESEKKGVPHHLFGIVEPEESFSVVRWLELARNKIEQLAECGRLPVIVGGTGLYISSLVDNIVFDGIGGNSDFREEMYRFAKLHGNSALLERLRAVDPDAASRLHENNVKRVIRALETFEASREPAKQRIERSRAKSSPYDACVIGIEFEDRQLLYDRIDNRVDAMLKAGLTEEARRHVGAGLPCGTAAQAIGHKELLPYFNGECDIDVCIDNLKRKTRNYAKRQLTWFRKDMGANKINYTTYGSILENAIYLINQKIL